ncbi:hypothetical protein [Chitinophaga sp. CB10]|uniref:hypothetical protein n=1 Tax=Chitinophaga sp. CB10 TaxID=1891659 RepID=UPI0025BD51C4|nr:hypothetical protein [Chitinophaga sp. CB10]
MKFEYFKNIDLNDPFFDSLKADYIEFSKWFEMKSTGDAQAYTSYDTAGRIQGFLYLKKENAALTDITPALPEKTRLKVGTFKITPHGTKMGERFIKKIFDYAVVTGIREIYVTIFPKHAHLISLLSKYGFRKVAEKSTANGTEDVLLKDMTAVTNSIYLNYPLISVSRARKFLLAIKPEYHTELFPDSKLFGEKYELIQDISHTNSIHKVYLCAIESVKILTPGDLLVIYRTSDQQGAAYYRSVASSICTVEEVLTRNNFNDIEEYLKYCQAHSIFSKEILEGMYKSYKPLYIIKMTYNAALTKRLNRATLINEIGLDAGQYWGFFELTHPQFNNILQKGEVNENIIID